MACAPIRRCWLSWLSPVYLEHDLFGKPVSTFPDHASRVIRSVDELTTKFVLDVNPNDVVETVFGGGKAELPRPFCFEIARPAVDNTHDKGIGLAADACRDVLSRNTLQGRDLLADGGGQSGHGEVA